MAAVVGLVQMLVTDAIRVNKKRANETPGLRAIQPPGVHADVEVAPDHQPGYVAADQQDAAGLGEPALYLMIGEESTGFSLQPLLALEQLRGVLKTPISQPNGAPCSVVAELSLRAVWAVENDLHWLV